MRTIYRSRFALLLATATALALPGAAIAAEPAPTAPPAPVVAWQTHLAHMQAMPGTFGAHVREHIATHGSMAGHFGPNGGMVDMMIR